MTGRYDHERYLCFMRDLTRPQRQALFLFYVEGRSDHDGIGEFFWDPMPLTSQEFDGRGPDKGVAGALVRKELLEKSEGISQELYALTEVGAQIAKSLFWIVWEGEPLFTDYFVPKY